MFDQLNRQQISIKTSSKINFSCPGLFPKIYAETLLQPHKEEKKLEGLMRGLGGYGWGTEMRGARPGSEVVSKMCKGALGRRESDFNLLRADIFPVTLLRHKLPSHFLLSTTTPQILLSPHHIAPKQFSNLGNSHHSCASSVAVKKKGKQEETEVWPIPAAETKFMSQNSSLRLAAARLCKINKLYLILFRSETFSLQEGQKEGVAVKTLKVP